MRTWMPGRIAMHRVLRAGKTAAAHRQLCQRLRRACVVHGVPLLVAVHRRRVVGLRGVRRRQVQPSILCDYRPRQEKGAKQRACTKDYGRS